MQDLTKEQKVDLIIRALSNTESYYTESTTPPSVIVISTFSEEQRNKLKVELLKLLDIETNVD